MHSIEIRNFTRNNVNILINVETRCDLVNGLDMISLHIVLGPVQTPLHSCAEPNTIRFDIGATTDRKSVV